MEEKTVRQRIIEALRGGFLSAKDISKAVGIREKDVREHLTHVARSVRRDERLAFEPSMCLSCGFSFRKRQRPCTPSRCHVCKSEEITETLYGIIPRVAGERKDKG